jgi:NEDD8-activating enzyme E1 regulatory subunit
MLTTRHLLVLLPSAIPPPLLNRSTRYGASELHTTASLIGGIAAQEAVKLITTQYMPLNNTYIYNGIAGVGGVLRV